MTGPVTGKDRIESLDVLRGVALLGILLMNITAMALPFQALSNPSVAGGDQGLNYAAWFITNTFFEGTMRTMFSVLFGAGFLLLMDRLAVRYKGLKAADIYYRRMLWLIAFGLFDGYFLLWTGDILYVYGVVGLLLFPIRNVAPKWLLAGAVALMILNVAASWLNYSDMTDAKAAYEQTQGVAAMEEATPAIFNENGDDVEDAVDAATANAAIDDSVEDALNERAKEWEETLFYMQPDAETLEAQVQLRNSDYISLFLRHIDINTDVHRDWVFFFLLPDHDALSAMLIGMVLLRLGVLTLAAPVAVYWGFVLIGYGIGVPVSLFETISYANSGYDPLVNLRNLLTYDVGRYFMAAGHTGVVLLLCRAGLFSRWRFAMARVGQMALTNYLLHSVLALFIFTGAGLALFGKVDRAEQYYFMAGFWAANITLSVIWLRYFRFGPAEWLWRTLTYMEWQPIRRRVAPLERPENSPAE